MEGRCVASCRVQVKPLHQVRLSSPSRSRRAPSRLAVRAQGHLMQQAPAQGGPTTQLMFSSFLIAFWQVKILFQFPREPLAPLWAAQFCRAKYCYCNCIVACWDVLQVALRVRREGSDYIVEACVPQSELPAGSTKDHCSVKTGSGAADRLVENAPICVSSACSAGDGCRILLYGACVSIHCADYPQAPTPWMLHKNTMHIAKASLTLNVARDTGAHAQCMDPS